MTPRLVELERRALQLKNSGKVAEAAELFSTIVDEQPNWEHGYGLHDLAQCYEDLGRFEEAEKFYRAALEHGPTDEILLGGLASFLYLHGKPEDAFQAYLKVLAVCKAECNEDGIKSCLTALNALGQRMGWSRDMIAEKIEKNIAV